MSEIQRWDPIIAVDNEYDHGGREFKVEMEKDSAGAWVAEDDCQEIEVRCKAQAELIKEMLEAFEVILRHEEAFKRTNQTWADRVDAVIAKAQGQQPPEPQAPPEMKRVPCEGVGDNDGFFEVEVPTGTQQPEPQAPPEDELYEKAFELASNGPEITIQALQAHLKIGYTRASKLMGELEKRGVVG